MRFPGPRPLRAARSRGGPLDQRRELGREIGAEHLGGGERDDLGARARRTLRAVGPGGSLLTGGALGGIGTAAGFPFWGAPFPPSPPCPPSPPSPPGARGPPGGRLPPPPAGTDSRRGGGRGAGR